MLSQGSDGWCPHEAPKGCRRRVQARVRPAGHRIGWHLRESPSAVTHARVESTNAHVYEIRMVPPGPPLRWAGGRRIWVGVTTTSGAGDPQEPRRYTADANARAAMGTEGACHVGVRLASKRTRTRYVTPGTLPISLKAPTARRGSFISERRDNRSGNLPG